MSAAAKSALVANRHVCGNSTINLEKARIILDESFRSSRIEGEDFAIAVVYTLHGCIQYY